jgi:crossover junction endodeoxyribonuclease RuvC
MPRNGRTSSRASSRIVAGFDVGTRRAGYCSLDVRGQDLKVRTIESWTVRGATIEDRIEDMAAKFSERLEADDPAWIAVEDGYVGRNPRTSLTIGMARGVALFVARTTTSAQVSLVDPSEARRACGVTHFDQRRGEAKAQVLVMVCRILGLVKAPDEDAADAAALAIWAAGRVWQVGMKAV